MTTAFPLILPQISINGTNQRELINQQLEVVSTLRAVLDAMGQASPNGRDYQHDPRHCAPAVAAWVERQTVVHNLMREIENHAVAISDLGGR